MKVRFHISTGYVHGGKEETFDVEKDLDINYKVLTEDELNKELDEAFNMWLGNLDSGWYIVEEGEL